MLQHGSILVDDDQSMIGRYLAPSAEPERIDTPPTATLHALLGRVPAAGEVADALFDAVRAREDRNASMLEPDDPSLAVATRIVRYEDPAWTWRR